MNLKRKVLPYIISFFLIGALSATVTQSVISSMESNWATVIPAIDGIFEESEWADAKHYSFNHTNPSPGHDPDFVHIYIKNTESELFLLFDDLPDDTVDVHDHLYVFFDANWDGIVDDNITMFLDRDHDPAMALPGNSIALWELGFDASPNKETAHTIIEVAMNISLEESYDGSSNAAELGNVLPVGTDNNSIRVMFSASFYICGWEIPQDGDIFQAETFGSLTFAIGSPTKGFGTKIILPILVITLLVPAAKITRKSQT